MSKTITFLLLTSIASASMQPICTQFLSLIQELNSASCIPIFDTDAGEFFKISRESGDAIGLINPNMIGGLSYDATLGLKISKSYSNGKYYLNLLYVDGYYVLKNDDTNNDFFKLIKRFVAIAELVKAANKNNMRITDLNPANIMIKEDNAALFVMLNAAKPSEADTQEYKISELEQLKRMYNYLFDHIMAKFIEKQMIRMDGISIYKFMQFQDYINGLTIETFSMDQMLDTLGKTYNEAREIFNYMRKHVEAQGAKTRNGEHKTKGDIVLTHENQQSFERLAIVNKPQVLAEDKGVIVSNEPQNTDKKQSLVNDFIDRPNNSIPSSHRSSSPTFQPSIFNKKFGAYSSGSINPIYFLAVIVVFVIAGYIIHVVITNHFRGRN